VYVKGDYVVLITDLRGLPSRGFGLKTLDTVVV